MIVLHHTTPTSSHLQAVILTPVVTLVLAGQTLIPTMVLDSEQASQQELQQALLREMLTDDRREEEDGLAETAGLEAILGEIPITAIHKDSVMGEDPRLRQDEAHLQSRQKQLVWRQYLGKYQ